MMWALSCIAVGFFSGIGFWGSAKVMDHVTKQTTPAIEVKKDVKE